MVRVTIWLPFKAMEKLEQFMLTNTWGTMLRNQKCYCVKTF